MSISRKQARHAITLKTKKKKWIAGDVVTEGWEQIPATSPLPKPGRKY